MANGERVWSRGGLNREGRSWRPLTRTRARREPCALSPLSRGEGTTPCDPRRTPHIISPHRVAGPPGAAGRRDTRRLRRRPRRQEGAPQLGGSGMNGIARCAESSDPWKHRVDEDKALGPPGRGPRSPATTRAAGDLPLRIASRFVFGHAPGHAGRQQRRRGHLSSGPGRVCRGGAGLRHGTGWVAGVFSPGG